MNDELFEIQQKHKSELNQVIITLELRKQQAETKGQEVDKKREEILTLNKALESAKAEIGNLSQTVNALKSVTHSKCLIYSYRLI